MRIVFTTQPGYGHLHPMLPLAYAARAAGHEITFATSARFRHVVETVGFPSLAAGLNWLLADDSTVPEEFRPKPGCTFEEFFAQQFVGPKAPLFAKDLIEQFTDHPPDVIVRETTEFGGAIAGEMLGTPVAAVQVASPSLMTPAIFEALDGPYNAAREAVGLRGGNGVDALAEQVVFCLAPPSLHDPDVPLPRNFLSVRPTTDAGVSTRIPAWADGLGRERPLVYATLGTVFNDPSYELPFFPAVLGGLRDEALDLVVTVGPEVDPASLGPQPANVHVHRYVPQSVILARCSAVVFHGGYGTLLAAIQHGIPIVIVPFGADQPVNARAAERLRLGVVIDPDALTPERLRSAIHAVLGDPEWRQNVRRIRDETDSLPPVETALGILEKIARRTAD